MKSNSIKILVKESNINFHNWYCTAEGYNHPIFKKYVGAVIPNWIIYIKNNHGQWGVIEFDWKKASDMFARRMELGKVDVDEIKRKHFQVGKKIKFLVDNVYRRKGLTDISTSSLSHWLKQMWSAYYYLNGIGFVCVISDFHNGYLMGKLSQILLQNKVDANKVQRYLSILSSPNQKTLFWQEQLELCMLCKKYKNIKKLLPSEDFLKHEKKWFWLNYGYQGPVWNRTDFIKRAEEIFKNKNLKSFIKYQQTEHKKLIAQQTALFKKLKLNKKEIKYFKAAQLFTYLKGYRIEMRHRYSYALDKIFLELGKRFNLPLNYFRYALKEEIVDTIAGRLVSKNDIINRKQKMLFVLENLKGKFISTNSIDKVLNNLLAKEIIPQTDSVSGQVAFSGKISGVAKILYSEKDIAKVNKGDILITFATVPDFLPAMTRAAAYVTDQGGITSHAAITAREFKKPCIIGTKFASKIFKDGDVVEVDANTGIVKKIK